MATWIVWVALVGCDVFKGGVDIGFDTGGVGIGDTGTSDPDPAIDPDLGCAVFPAESPWNTDISNWRVHDNSANFIDTIGANGHLHPDFGTEWEGAPIGIPVVTVPNTQAKVLVSFGYADESDPGPYPIPADVPIEGGDYGEGNDGDRHVLIVDKDTCVLYELYNAWPHEDGSWDAGSGAIWDLTVDDRRPAGWTSADAAGLPILPGLVRYEEVVEQGVIDHALRFTVSDSMRGYVDPASHFASDCSPSECPNNPPMGLRLRMQQNYDCSGYSAEAQVVCTALKTYGMIVADNGSNWYISGEPNPLWNDEALGDLKQIPGSAFDVVDSGDIVGD